MAPQANEAHRSRAALSIWVVLGIIGVLVGIALGVWWRFVRVPSTASFIPRDTISVFFVNVDRTSAQVEEAKRLGESFGGRDYFPDLLQDILLPVGDQYIDVDKEELKLWFGNEVAIVKARTTNDPVDLVVIEITNQQQAKAFVDDVTTKLEQRGRAVSNDSFRGQTITSIEGGDAPIHFVLLESHLLVSNRLDGVRMMLDTRAGKLSSIATDKEFRRAQRRLASDQPILFFQLDILEVIRQVPRISNLLDPRVVATLLGGDLELPLYGAVLAQEDGATVDLFIPERSDTDAAPVLRSELAQSIPSSAILFWESEHARGLLEQLVVNDQVSEVQQQEALAALSYVLRTEYDTQLEDVYRAIEGPYAAALLQETPGQPLAAVMILEVDSDRTQRVLPALERVVLDRLSQSAARSSAATTFTTHTVEGETYRYLNLPDDYGIDLAVRHDIERDLLIIATTDEAMQQVVALQALPDSEQLANQQIYEVTTDRLERSDMTRSIYVDTQEFLRFLESVGQIDYGRLHEAVRIPDESVGITWEERIGTRAQFFVHVFE